MLVKFKCISILLIVFGSSPPIQAASSSQGVADITSLKVKVEKELGLAVAIVNVRLENPSPQSIIVPLRGNAFPIVQIALPQSWLAKQGKQRGSQFAVLMDVEHKVLQILPGARVDIQLIQDPILLSTKPVGTIYFAKNFAILLGLCALFLTSVIASRRKSNEQILHQPIERSASIDASEILQMKHELAKQAIDDLKGVRRIAVLQAIALSEVEELPVVQIESLSSAKTYCD